MTARLCSLGNQGFTACGPYAAWVGRQVRCGRRQSMPSSNIESCAVDKCTAPESACGQIKRPFSKRLMNRHMPSPLHQRTLSKSPRRPRKANTCPEKGSSVNVVCTNAAKPFMPRRISVTPAASHICVPAGNPINSRPGRAAHVAPSNQEPCVISGYRHRPEVRQRLRPAQSRLPIARQSGLRCE